MCLVLSIKLTAKCSGIFPDLLRTDGRRVMNGFFQSEARLQAGLGQVALCAYQRRNSQPHPSGFMGSLQHRKMRFVNQEHVKDWEDLEPLIQSPWFIGERAESRNLTARLAATQLTYGQGWNRTQQSEILTATPVFFLRSTVDTLFFEKKRNRELI